ncbi:MAG TPA: glycosyltransferase family 4 protein [Thermoanaerobaculia bacterium]|nr:glycosyltransferase family 4 protein [Thermoanaerobaculia bacterium]
MTHVLFITQTANAWGGVESWLEGLAGALDFDVTIGLVRGRFHDPEHYRAARRSMPPSIEIAAPTGTPEGRVRALVKAIETVRADIVVPVNIVDVLEAARRIKQHRDLRLLYPMHSITSDYLLDLRAFAPIIDLVVTTNRLALRATETIAGIDRVVRARYGIAPPLAPPEFATDGPLSLLYAGRLTQEQKRIRDLVAVVRSLERRGVEHRLEIAGDGDELAYLRRELPNATFHGLVSSETLDREIYPRADAMLLLSDWETGPIAAWEAMRYGLALVTTRYRGLTAEGILVDGDNAAISDVGDTEALAASVERLSRDRALLERMRRSAVATAEREFDPRQSVADWHSAFERVIASTPARGAVAYRPAAAGRLDRIAGRAAAETVRGFFARSMPPTSAGSEWPHTLHWDDPERSRIDAAVAELDR